MKYLKGLLFCLGLLLIFNLIITIFSYFDIFKSNTIEILKIVTFLIAFIASGIYIGLNSKEKGYLEGIKFSLLFIGISIILSLIIPNINLSIKSIIYYLIIIILSIIGSTIGINKKKSKN